MHAAQAIDADEAFLPVLGRSSPDTDSGAQVRLEETGGLAHTVAAATIL